METLRDIVLALKRIEFCKLVIYYWNNKMLERVKLLKLSKRGISDSKAMLYIYKSIDNSAFSHLKSEFIKDIVNLLAGNEIYRREKTDISTYCKDLIFAAEILIRRKAYIAAKKLLNDALKLAVKHKLINHKVLINDNFCKLTSDIGDKMHGCEKRFYRNFYKQKYDRAGKLVNSCLYDDEFKYVENNAEIWYFFKANLEFVNGNHHASIELLTKKCRFKDKPRLKCYRYILMIMNYVELDDDIRAENGLDAFKKWLSRNKVNVKPRLQYIINILSHLLANSCSYQETFNQYQQEINELSINKNGCGWDKYGPELIRFENWMKTKDP